MSRNPVTLDHLDAGEKARFRSLTQAPRLAWPTTIMWILLVASYLASYWFCGTGRVPLWIGTITNTLVGYMAFSVAHDAIHRSISSNARLNDAIGQIGILMVEPFVDIRLFRWAHILHHRFTSAEKDPDVMFRGAWWSLPIRWMLIDFAYFVHALNNGDRVSAPYFRNSLRLAAATIVLIAALIWAGYGMEVLMLWFVPSRLILLILGFSFFWLPHVPHDVTQEENFTRATTVRKGHEWLLGPLLQYQHYHLIHHMYPTTPFYNNYKVWKLIEPVMDQHDVAVQHGFAIHPVIYPASGKPQT